MKALKQKVLVYLTRETPAGVDLLVFEHKDIPSAGIQVPAGTVDANEDLVFSARREILEESGLDLSCDFKFVGSYNYHRKDIDEHQMRNVFHVDGMGNLPESWEHTVGGSGEDEHLVFRFYWIPLVDAEKALAGEQGRYLEFIYL